MFWRVVGDAVAVAVKVQPKSRRPGLQGQVDVTAGAASRRKTLLVSGDATAIIARLAAL